jgi:hypothetical protein
MEYHWVRPRQQHCLSLSQLSHLQLFQHYGGYRWLHPLEQGYLCLSQLSRLQSSWFVWEKTNCNSKLDTNYILMMKELLHHEEQVTKMNCEFTCTMPSSTIEDVSSILHIESTHCELPRNATSAAGEGV